MNLCLFVFTPLHFRFLLCGTRKLGGASRKGLAERTLGSFLPRARTWVATPLHTGGIASMSNTGRGRGGGSTGSRIVTHNPSSRWSLGKVQRASLSRHTAWGSPHSPRRAPWAWARPYSLAVPVERLPGRGASPESSESGKRGPRRSSPATPGVAERVLLLAGGRGSGVGGVPGGLC